MRQLVDDFARRWLQPLCTCVVGFGEFAVGGLFQQKPASLLRTSWLVLPRSVWIASSRTCGIRIVERHQSARAMAISFLTAESGFDGGSLAKKFERRFVRRTHHVVHGFDPYRCIGTRQGEVRDGCSPAPAADGYLC